MVKSFVCLGLWLFVPGNSDDTPIKLADCPGAVQSTLKAEIGSAKVELVNRETDESGATTYWADVLLLGKTYSIGVLGDGTLVEMTLGLDADEVLFERLPAAVQATFKSEGFGLKIDRASKELKFGVQVYEAVVNHKGRRYELVVAEEGTLVEKVLVIEDDEVEFSRCPAAVQATLTKHAGADMIQEVTRYSGIVKPTYEAEVEINGKVYLIEVAESGVLISKSLEATEDE